jgi:hypothetical protein
VSARQQGSLHAHGCVRCHIRYQDACTESGDDALCITCRGGRGWQLLIDNAAPHDCCREHSRMVRKEEQKTYRLAGKHLWHICTTCARTHPMDPRRTP